jgi:translation initiation factor RLI1
LQRVAICLVLGVPADVLLIDEPSAYLDSEQRIIASKVIKKFVMGAKKTAFVVEHDFVRVYPYYLRAELTGSDHGHLSRRPCHCL